MRLLYNGGTKGVIKMNFNKKNTTLIFGLSFLVFLAITLWGKFILEDGDEMGFILLNFYAIMPVVSLVSGILLGLNDDDLKWGYPLVFGLLGVVIPPFIIVNAWDWIAIFFSLVPSIIGLVIGMGMHQSKARKSFQ